VLVGVGPDVAVAVKVGGATVGVRVGVVVGGTALGVAEGEGEVGPPPPL